MRVTACGCFVHQPCTHSLPPGHRYDKTDALRAAFLRYFDQELTDWLLCEMAENRDKQLGPKKVRLPDASPEMSITTGLL